MIQFEHLKDPNVLIIRTDGPLEKADFAKFAENIEASDTSPERPTRLMIRARSFPGWENFEAFSAHLAFVIKHHHQIEKIAVVSDSEFLKVMPHIGNLLVHPKIKQFDFDRYDEALAWLQANP